MAAAAVAADAHPQQQGVLVAIDPHLDDGLDLPAGGTLCQSSPRERDQYQASPVAIVFASASRFMWASIRISPVAASTARAVISPSAPKRGMNAVPSSISALLPGSAKPALIACRAPG